MAHESPKLNETWKGQKFASTDGKQPITVEVLDADPTLTVGEPRIWINAATGELKFTHDGETVKTVTAT